MKICRKPALALQAAIIVALATPALADIRADADTLIAQSFHEHRIFFSCMEQTEQMVGLAQNWMSTAVEDAIPQLTEIGYTAEEIGGLVAAAAFDNIALPDDATMGELRALCAENPEWLRDMQFMNMVILSRDLQELIDAQ